MKTTNCRVPVIEQLALLLLLEDGWYDGDGKAYDGDALIKVREMLDSLVTDSIPVPYIYPTLNNEVRAEWDTDAGAVVLTIAASGDEATFSVDEECAQYSIEDARLRLLTIFAPDGRQGTGDAALIPNNVTSEQVVSFSTYPRNLLLDELVMCTVRWNIGPLEADERRIATALLDRLASLGIARKVHRERCEIWPKPRLCDCPWEVPS